jgi:hypothetical protein
MWRFLKWVRLYKMTKNTGTHEPKNTRMSSWVRFVFLATVRQAHRRRNTRKMVKWVILGSFRFLIVQQSRSGSRLPRLREDRLVRDDHSARLMVSLGCHVIAASFFHSIPSVTLRAYALFYTS